MFPPRRRTVAATLCLLGGLLCPLTHGTAAAADATYTVTVGATGSWTHPDDTPAARYLDKDGTFYLPQAHALYGANDTRQWTFFTGTNLDTATRSSALSDAAGW